MSRLRQVFATSLAIALPISLVFVDRMESRGNFDSIGWWYSVVVAATIAVPVALGAVGLFLLATRIGPK